MIRRLRREASAPAMALGTKPVASIAALILRIVACETLEGSLSARDTVTWLTPAMRPTASIVTPRAGGRRPGGASPVSIPVIFQAPRILGKLLPRPLLHRRRAKGRNIAVFVIEPRDVCAYTSP
ncbi:hypothetical protein LCGC14_2840730 [marine sediment metagenome]|uniref:Uncharacterized protein n=1 Tax=marine sediment metagenome TaxID=412755 RepID=A0A0F8YXY3_9ZZZZ